MNKETCKKQYKEKKDITLTIRIEKSLSKWMAKEGYSPTGIFIEATKQLGYKG